MRTDFETVNRIELAARQHRAQVIAGLIGSAFAWIVSHLRSKPAVRAHSLARGW
jgi:hypothetical protein